MFHVVHGYCSPDRYTNSDNDPVLEYETLSSEAEVLKLYERYKEEVMNNDEASHITFVVIEGGVVRNVVEKARVTEFKLA